VSTEAETRLFTNHLPLEDKKITAEACVHYLSLNESDYPRLGMRMKVNPAIKSAQDQQALLRGLLDNRIDIITTDHAPHLLSEKQNSYTKAPSGTPLVQHALQLMLQLVKEGKLEITRLVDKMSHSPALCYQIDKRGYIREGYFADMVLVNPNKPYTVDHDNVLYKCGWSVYEGETFAHSIEKTFVNGNIVYDRGIFTETHKGMRIKFSRG
jgi:dihydroorotase